MPRISTIRNNPILNPQNDVGAFGLSMNFRIPTGALVADWITLLQMERDGYLFAGSFAVLATLGASCTVQLVHANATDTVVTPISAATTAGGADREQLTRGIRFVKGDTISLLVAGATVAAAADLELDLLLAHVPIIRAKA
jgi:hypothetical protein